METQPSPKILLTHFDWTVQRMDEVLRQEKNDYFRDAALHRFGLTYDLALKCIRAFAALEGLSCDSARKCFALAAEKHWLESEIDWKEMVESYDRVKQKENGESAEVIYTKLPGYCGVFKGLYHHLSSLKEA